MSNLLITAEMSMKHIFLFGLVVLSSLGIHAQSQRAFLEAADKSLANKEYYSAMHYYGEALAFDSTRLDVAYNYAESARMFNAFTKAAKFYQQVIDKDSDNKYPDAPLNLGHVHMAMGHYQKAKDMYNLYLSEQAGVDAFNEALAKKQIADADWAILMSEKEDAGVIVMNFGEAVNTPYSEFGALQLEDQLLFSSMQYLPENTKQYSKKYISKILSYKDPLAPEEYGIGFNRESISTAHITFNINKSRIYYTHCEYINGNDLRCQIYSRAVLGDGRLGDEIKLPSPINLDGITSTQPSVGFDKTAGEEILYFVSDRTGGKGKLDIYKVPLLGIDKYGEISNLSEINTADDDITPFFHNNSQTLYFSSEGYTSMGGFDIYATELEGAKFKKPENIGSPYNSSYDDVYYTLNDDGSQALFSSNRLGSQFIESESEACCYDIYKAEVEDVDIDLNVFTFDKTSRDSLEGVTVKIFDAETGELLGEITNDIGSDHLFKLQRNKNYMVVSSKRGFATDTMSVNTFRVPNKQAIIKKVYLERETYQLDVFTFDKITELPLPGTTVKLINLTDNTEQVITLTNNVGNDFTFDIIPGHRYRLEANRENYYGATDEFTATGENNSGIITKKLYLTRRDLNIYLPLAVYFDNDLPEARTRGLSTRLTYTETFDKYIIRKFDFVERYATNMNGAEKALAEKRMAEFFDQDVRAGYDRMNNFLGFLLGELRAGKSFDISIKGYASPRADERYNLALSQRRVVSVQNELRAFAQGGLVQFINNGQLRITELAYGESLAPDNVSDALYDRRNSVYSPEASRERRVEIVEIKSSSGLRE